MGWGALIAVLVEVLSPLVADWLKECAEDRAKRAAARLPAYESFASEEERLVALFDEIDAGLPTFAPVRHRFVRRAKEAALRAGVTSAGAARPLDAGDAAELAALGAAAGGE